MHVLQRVIVMQYDSIAGLGLGIEGPSYLSSRPPVDMGGREVNWLILAIKERGVFKSVIFSSVIFFVGWRMMRFGLLGFLECRLKSSL